MLRPALTRRIARARGLRLPVRRLYGPSYPHEPAPLPPLASLSLDERPPPTFPLYRPSPPSATAPQSSPRYPDPQSLPSDAKIARSLKVQLSKRAVKDLPPLEEDDLREFYAALVESGAEEAARRYEALDVPKEERLRLGDGEREQVLRGLAERLLGVSAPEAPPVEAQGGGNMVAGPSRLTGIVSGDAVPTQTIIHALASISSQNEDLNEGGLSDLPLGLVSRKEWDALFDQTLSETDPGSAEVLLGVMQAHGVPPSAEHLSEIITHYASHGLLGEAKRLESVLAEAGYQLSPDQHDVLTSAHLHTSGPIGAIAHLKTYELSSHPAPQSSYGLVLSHLLERDPSSHTRALAWDLFAHMRLSAHPTPSRDIYRLMITSCCSSSDPQPERARDLWIELTQDNGSIPDEPEYTAAIRALSSTKKDYLEAFDLLRQMLARHHEATYVPFSEDEDAWAGRQRQGQRQRSMSRWIPGLETWKALLEGTKRAGDLPRARWVLAESLRMAGASEVAGYPVKGPDEDMMASVFMTYAAWKPIVARRQVRVRSGVEAEDISRDSDSQKSTAGITSDTVQHTEDPLVDVGLTEEISAGDRDAQDVSTAQGEVGDSTSPQTAADALGEASALFHQILQPTSSSSLLTNPFRDTRPSTRLVNSYLSVQLAHSQTLAAARTAWDETWSDAVLVERGVRPNGWSYLIALEKCALGNRQLSQENREEATSWGRKLWSEYLSFQNSLSVSASDSGSNTSNTGFGLGLGPRQIERAWRAIIRIHTLADDTAGALSLLSEFQTRHPPSRILNSYAPIPDAGLGLRFTDPTTVREADVPPHMLFEDVRALHQRLVRDEDGRGVGMVKWVTTGYEKALEKRRKWRLEGAGKGGEVRSRRVEMIAAVNGEESSTGLERSNKAEHEAAEHEAAEHEKAEHEEGEHEAAKEA